MRIIYILTYFCCWPLNYLRVLLLLDIYGCFFKAAHCTVTLGTDYQQVDCCVK